MTETEGIETGIETAIETATVAIAVAVVAATVGSGTGGRDLGGIKALKRFEFRKNRGRRLRSALLYFRVLQGNDTRSAAKPL